MMKKMNFRNKLFIYYSLIMIAVVIVGFGSVYWYIIDQLELEILQSMNLSARDNARQLDSLMKEMDRLTIEVSANPQIQEYMQKLKKGELPAYNTMSNMAYNTLISISAVNLGSIRVSIYNKGGDYLSIGIPDNQTAIRERTSSEAFEQWYEQQMPERHSSRKLLPHPDFWSADEEEQMISVIREIVDIHSYASYGVVEVQVPLKRLEDLFRTGLDQKQYLFTNDAELIYTNGTEAEQEEAVGQLCGMVTGRTEGEGKIRLSNRRYYTTFGQSSQTGWYFAIARPRQTLLNTAFPVVGVAFLIAVILLGLMLLFIRLVSVRLTEPLKKLQMHIKTINSTDKIVQADTEEKDEILMIDTAFDTLYKNLQLSNDELNYMKLQEAKIQLLAVQAQMNPHFLYNILTVINGIGFEYGATEIMEICDALSSMLRYAGSFSWENVRMEEEIVHTRHYLELMKCRFKSHMQYHIEIDPELTGIRVPKLILQPIVENSFQHGLKGVKPPWKIRVQVLKQEDQWLIRVMDNGAGFTREAVENLYRQIRNQNDDFNDNIESLGIGGYGLTNVILRLKLSYGLEVHFRIDQVTEAGEAYCMVEIGGRIGD